MKTPQTQRLESTLKASCEIASTLNGKLSEAHLLDEKVYDDSCSVSQLIHQEAQHSHSPDLPWTLIPFCFHGKRFCDEIWRALGRCHGKLQVSLPRDEWRAYSNKEGHSSRKKIFPYPKNPSAVSWIRNARPCETKLEVSGIHLSSSHFNTKIDETRSASDCLSKENDTRIHYFNCQWLKPLSEHSA